MFLEDTERIRELQREEIIRNLALEDSDIMRNRSDIMRNRELKGTVIDWKIQTQIADDHWMNSELSRLNIFAVYEAHFAYSQVERAMSMASAAARKEFNARWTESRKVREQVNSKVTQWKTADWRDADFAAQLQKRFQLREQREAEERSARGTPTTLTPNVSKIIDPVKSEFQLPVIDGEWDNLLKMLPSTQPSA